MRFIAWSVGVPVAVVAVAFSIANRGGVRLDLWPLPFSVDMPVYLAVLAPLVAGVLLGGLLAWISAGHLRARIRERNTRVVELERELVLAQSRTQDSRDEGTEIR